MAGPEYRGLTSFGSVRTPHLMSEACRTSRQSHRSDPAARCVSRGEKRGTIGLEGGENARAIVWASGLLRGPKGDAWSGSCVARTMLTRFGQPPRLVVSIGGCGGPTMRQSSTVAAGGMAGWRRESVGAID